MTKIYPDLYRFSAHFPSMHFTIHQHLLMSEEAIFISTGTALQAEQILPEVKELLHEINAIYTNLILKE